MDAVSRSPSSDDTEPVTVDMVRYRSAPPGWGWTWWRQLALGVLLVWLLAVVRWRVNAATGRQAQSP